MALTDFTPTYLSHDDFKLVTNVTSLKSIALADYKLLAQRAEFVIDSYVGGQRKFDFDQDTVFPRCEDIDVEGNAIIPDPVAMATARMVESLFKDGETKSSKKNSLKSEKIGDYSYSKGTTSSDSKGVDLLSGEAKLYLQQFRRAAVQISIPAERRRDGRLNSRQHFLKGS